MIALDDLSGSKNYVAHENAHLDSPSAFRIVADGSSEEAEGLLLGELA
jgi:hypothetical protein